MFSNKVLGTLAVLCAAGVSAQDSTCTGLEDCGVENTGYPFYYDPAYMPKHMHTMTKIAGANAIIVPFVFFSEEYIAHSAQYGVDRMTMDDYSDFMTKRDHFTPRLEALEMATMAHLGVWGTVFALDILGLTRGFRIIFAPIAALWMEHIISNLHIVLVGYVAYLFFNADFNWFSISAYVTQGIIMW